MTFPTWPRPCGRIRGENEMCRRHQGHDGECDFKPDGNVQHGRCTHPNAYAYGGGAMMYCPTCGPFKAGEE